MSGKGNQQENGIVIESTVQSNNHEYKIDEKFEADIDSFLPAFLKENLNLEDLDKNGNWEREEDPFAEAEREEETKYSNSNNNKLNNNLNYNNQGNFFQQNQQFNSNIRNSSFGNNNINNLGNINMHNNMQFNPLNNLQIQNVLINNYNNMLTNLGNFGNVQNIQNFQIINNGGFQKPIVHPKPKYFSHGNVSQYMQTPNNFSNNNFNFQNNMNYNHNNNVIANNFGGNFNNIQEFLNFGKINNILKPNRKTSNFSDTRGVRNSSEESTNSNSNNEKKVNSAGGSPRESTIKPRKGYSSGNIAQFNKADSKKRSLFNDKQKRDEIIEINLSKFLDNLEVKLSEFICGQKGSRVMQKYLNKITPEDLNLLIHKLGKDFSVLMTDTYGNYFCQKMIQSCSVEQRIDILTYINKQLPFIAFDPSGTHALQSLLEITNLPEEETMILEAIKNKCLEMAFDSNATHVVQKIIVCIDESKRENINSVILNNFKSLSLDVNGICVIKKFINSNMSDEIKQKIMQEIYNDALEIAQSPFGNYAVQQILQQWGYKRCEKISKIIETNVISLSMQKYSSNVVEKFLEAAGIDERKILINELFNASKFSGLIKNKYGGFVITKAISYMTPSEKESTRKLFVTKIDITSSKDKSRMDSFLKLLD